MLFNLSSDLDRDRFRTRAAALYKRGSVVELTERTKRTKPQNSYLHLVIGVVAMETGNTLEYTKQHYFKEAANAELFVRTKEDNVLRRQVAILRSSADLSVEEMSLAIDRFKRWAAGNGIYIPEQGDETRLQEIMLEMDRCRAYL